MFFQKTLKKSFYDDIFFNSESKGFFFCISKSLSSQICKSRFVIFIFFYKLGSIRQDPKRHYR